MQMMLPYFAEDASAGGLGIVIARDRWIGTERAEISGALGAAEER